MKTQIKILIADDHEVVLNGLSQLLSSNYPKAEVNKVQNYEELNSWLKKEVPDLLITDLKMGKSAKISNIQSLSERYPTLPIIVHTMFEPKIYALRLYRQGIKGYICKTSSSQDLLRAVDLALNGKTYICPESASLIIDQQARQDADPIETLSDREYEIMLLLVNGYSIGQISELLCIHTSTISTYKHRILSKLGLDNDVELTLHAVEKDLIE